jgi:geranylgeranyl pyrophosphate synthase
MLNVHSSWPILRAWRRNRKRRSRTIYKIAAKQTRVGEVEATDEREAIEKAAKEFRQHALKLIAVRRR